MTGHKTQSERSSVEWRSAANKFENSFVHERQCSKVKMLCWRVGKKRGTGETVWIEMKKLKKKRKKKKKKAAATLG